MTINNLWYKWSAAAIGSPEENAATATEAAAADTPISQVALQKGILVSTGDKSDSAATNHTSSWSVIALLKGMHNIFANIGVATTPAFTDDAAFTPGTTKTQPVAGTYRSTRDAVDDGDAGTLAMNAKRGLYVSPESPNGDSLVDDTADALKVITSTADTMIGSLTETAPASDTASSGLNGRLQRVAQRLTSLIALFPASLGAKAAAASLSVTLATEDVALFPASLGQKTMANGFAVTIASDQTTFPISPGASAATGGIASTSRIVSAANTTNATSAKASAGRVYAIQGYNAATGIRYLKLYNKASSPTVGTDTPVKTLALPPGVAFAFDWPHGYSFATGIAYALTTGSADSDTGALTAADVLGLNVDYV